MKILIVDDEDLVRIGLRSMLDWAMLDCEIVGEAATGAEALEMARQLQPDMILLDITMPNTDGLEVIRALRCGGRRPTIIVVSCHEDFAIVREALVSGADDYLLKHTLKAENLRQLIEKHRASAGAIAYSPQAEELSFRIAAERFLLQGETAGLESYFGAAYARLAILLVHVRDYEAIRSRYLNRPPNYFATVVSDVALKALSMFPHRRVVPYRAGDFCAFIAVEDESPGLCEAAAKLAGILKKFINVDVCVGVSLIATGDRRFSEAYYQAESAMGSSFFDDESTVLGYIPFEITVWQKELSRRMQELGSELREALEAQNRDRFAQALSEAEKRLGAYRMIGASTVRKVLEILFCQMFDFPLLERKCFTEKIAGAETYRASALCFLSAFDLYSQRRLPQLDSENFLARQAIEFLRKNYADEITLQVLAGHLHVSCGYISRLFKAATGVNIFKYLNQLRIEQAKRLLQDPALKPYQVADQVGFKNRVYFDNVFKTYTGCTPSEYRRNAR